MSNALAVPAVTATLSTIVQSAVDRLGLAPRPLVAPGPLDDSSDNARVGVHLYRVTRNPALSIEDLPTRSAGGELRQKLRAALDLHYLFTFHGTGGNEWEAQRLLAKTAAALHAEPVLTAARIADAEIDHPEIAGNDLAAADERVRVVPDMLSIDELTRLWALYPPASFTVTLGVIAGPVLVDADGDPGAVLPVHRVAAGAFPFDAPRLDQVSGPDGPGAPVRAATPMPNLNLFGAALSARPGETVEVLLDGVAAPTVTVADDQHIVVGSPGLAPGAHRVQVRRNGPPLDPASSTPVRVSSNSLTMSVAPTLGALNAATGPGSHAGLRSGTVTAAVTPNVSAAQRVRLLLDSTALTPPAALAVSATLTEGDPPTGSVDFAVHDARAGTYRATLEVDGARSIPPLDSNGNFVLPVVTL